MDRIRRFKRLASLRDILIALRKSLGLTQVDVAQRLGEHQSYISNYENGEKRLDLAELEELAGALGTPLVEIVRRFEATKKTSAAKQRKPHA